MPAKVLPMFPLGSVLFPHALLPLHLFEPRYLALADTVLQGDGRFGVVLIERGREVGAATPGFGSARSHAIVEAARTPEGGTCSPRSAPSGSGCGGGSTTTRTRAPRSR